MNVEKAIEVYAKLSPADKVLAHEELNKMLKHKELIMKVLKEENYGVKDDIFQKLGIKALALEFSKPGGDEKYYKNLICKAAKNLAHDMRRERKWWPTSVEAEKEMNREAEDKDEVNATPCFVNPLADAMNKEAQREVESLLAQIAGESEAWALYVKIFKMEMLDGLTPVEIARRVHVARNHVDVAVGRVRAKLRTLFKN